MPSYLVSVLPEEGGIPASVFKIESAVAIDQDVLKAAGLVLDEGVSRGRLKSIVELARCYVTVHDLWKDAAARSRSIGR